MSYASRKLSCGLRPVETRSLILEMFRPWSSLRWSSGTLSTDTRVLSSLGLTPKGACSWSPLSRRQQKQPSHPTPAPRSWHGAVLAPSLFDDRSFNPRWICHVYFSEQGCLPSVLSSGVLSRFASLLFTLCKHLGLSKYVYKVPGTRLFCVWYFNGL